MSKSQIPSSTALQSAILRALERRGGAASNEEQAHDVAMEAGLSEATRTIPHADRGGGRSEFEYRMAWARTKLKLSGRIESSGRKQWRIKAS